ncbi:MAG: hypothetical protein AMJ88_01955 [Anaerolineae bacterium SM23_ 63]|nr:MAG: hypothetical protein AMJ88_01955 [Anaerolineae bacterium SM23_ 63]HEY46450.1 hypothetical protein [Anaerolineae bacterium]
MNQLIEALAPVLIASFAIQQLIELLDPILDTVIKAHKKWILSAVAFIAGLALTLGLELRVLAPFGITRFPWVDVILTTLFITGGTKGVNDLMKLIGYKKEEAKAAFEAA